MSTPDLSAKLPPPHDEEPAQLRSDILDELQDHLACAVDRERRRLELSEQPTDAVTIWQAVIERFGDPSALARRLWFDAMKGRLMTQRVLLGAVAVAVVALIGWMTLLSRSLTAVIDENQKATAAVLERLGKESPVSSAKEALDLTPVKFTLVQGTSDGPPVTGKVIHFDQHPGKEELRLGDLSETTNSQGVGDFGYLPYGIYDLTIDAAGVSLSEQITLRPGRPINMRIAVPEEPKLGQVKFEFSPPEWDKWDWTTPDHKPPAGEPMLLIRYSHRAEVRLDDLLWQSQGDTETVVVRSDGIYTKFEDVKVTQSSMVQFGGGGSDAFYDDDLGEADRVIDTISRVETLTLPQGTLRVVAEWMYEVSDDQERHQLLARPVGRSLNPEYARSLKSTRDHDRHGFPLLLDIDPAAAQPQVIRIPSNDPSTFDGEDRPPLIPNTGGGGFF